MSQTLPPVPPKGSMYLFDYVTMPLLPDSYKIEARTHVQGESIDETLTQTRYFDVVGSRFALSPAEFGGVFPPRNGRGPFEGLMPHIAIKRRTLPWERKIADALPRPAHSGLPADYPVPWLAVLLLEDGEYKILEDVPLESVVPAATFQALGSPNGVRVTALEVEPGLLRDLMPSIEELQLLTHVRWVNKEDRELSVEGSDGWFSVVMSNRLPRNGVKYRACLVSLEQRATLVPVDPPNSVLPPKVDVRFRLDREVIALDAHQLPAPGPRRVIGLLPDEFRRGVIDYGGFITDTEAGKLGVPDRERLVVLYTWQFTCEGAGTFKGLMQCLDVGMIGKPDKTDQPELADTGHIRLQMKDRAGLDQTVWYRGPLVPFELTRDALGPYHSADQARRAAPEAGAEDVSYAAAFEVGRLLAAADARLGQELMRWRREAFRQGGRTDVIERVRTSFDLMLPAPIVEQLHAALPPIVATSVIEKIVAAGGPIADPTDLDRAGLVVGLDAARLQQVWNLETVSEARAIIGEPGVLGAEARPHDFTAAVVTSLEDLVSHPEAIGHLTAERDLMIDATRARLEGQP